MRVGEHVVMNKVESNRFQVWAHAHGRAVTIRTIGGEVLVFKARKKKSRKGNNGEAK
jgi:hypothetical protein